jgi:hypothetical protein
LNSLIKIIGVVLALVVGTAVIVGTVWLYFPSYTPPVKAADGSANAVVLPAGTVPLAADSTLHYFRDERTDLCFAFHRGAQFAADITNVPCTDKVKALLEQP